MRPQTGKQKIFNAAMILFEQKGYFKTTISEITKQAGVSKGLVYNYFASKELLLIGLLEQATEKMQGQAIVFTTDDSVENSIAKFIDSYFSFLKQEKSFLTLQLSLMLSPELKSIVRSSVQERAEILLMMVFSWLRQLKTESAKHKARLIIALLDGIALHYLLIYEKYPLSSLKKSTKKSILLIINQ
jgi:AcrR family transcriptional regulator